MDLRKLVAEVADRMERGDESDAFAEAPRLRAALADRGLGPNCHTDLGDLEEGSELAVEWWIGQFLNIVDKEAWTGMARLLNLRWPALGLGSGKV